LEVFLLIMNELQEKTEGGTDMVKNFPELLSVTPRVLEHHPAAWETARRTLFRHNDGLIAVDQQRRL